MKIVVTGALGHIGSQLIRKLPNAFSGSNIILIDNLLTQRYCSLFDLPKTANFLFLDQDIMQADLASIFKGSDVVIHLAAITDAASSFEKAEEIETVNFKGTEKVAQACLKVNSPLIFLSTTSVYGTQEAVVDENCSITELKPQSPYGESKLKSEEMLKNLGHNVGLRFIILRFGTIVGVSPGMRFHTAVNKFVWQACLGKPISVWSTALDQCRPYLELGEAINALIFIMQNKFYNKEVYNVLTANKTVREITDTIRKQVPDLQIEYVDSKIMNQLSYNVAREKFQTLGFEFSASLETAIQETVARLRATRGFSI